jgi:phage protein U
MFAQLGDIRFDLITYFDGLNTSKKIDYAEHATIEGKPKLQYIGEALETININLNFHMSFCDPSAEVRRLKDAASKYEPLSFIYGNGIYKGNYVIEEINDNVQQTFNEGTLIAIDVEVKLKEWIKDKAITTKQAKTTKKSVKKKQNTVASKTGTNKDNVSFKKIVRQ